MTKKLQILISVVAFLCFALSVNAQDFTNGGKYIFKNVESGKFLGAANSWGTQASLLNNSEYVIMWENGDGTYWIESQVSSGGTNYYLGSNGWLDSAPVSLAIIPSGDYYLMTPDSVSYYGYNGTSVMALNLSANDEGALWQIISVEDMLASFENATVDNPVDATFLILDPNFGRNNRNSWAWTIEATNWNLSGGNNTNNCAESWHSTFTLSQTLENMPSGIYKLSAQGFYRDDGTEEDYPYFYIGDQTRTFPQIQGSENNMSDASSSFNAGLYYIEPITFVGGGDITIGAKLNSNELLWCIWDNFTLTYCGPTAEDPEKMMLENSIARALAIYPLAGLDELVASDNTKSYYRDQIESAQEATSDYAEYRKNVEDALSELSKSVSAYEKLFAKFDEWNRYMAEVDPIMADNKDWQQFCTLMTDESVSVNGLPNSSPYAIQHGNYSINADDIPEYITTVEAALRHARFSIATFDNPYIIQDNKTDLNDWIREFTGDGASGTFVLNTWSTEANNGKDGTDMVTPFIESWVSDGYTLSDERIYQPLVVAPGLYKLTIDARLYGYGVTDAFEGIKMFFGDEELNLQEQGNMTSPDASHKILWSKDYFSIVAIVDKTGIINFGFEIENANFNWLAFKNVSVAYYGNENVEENAIALLKASYAFDGLPAQTTAHPALIAAYNDAVAAFNAATTVDEVWQSAQNANNALIQINENTAAYDKLFAKFAEWESYIEENPNRSSDQWTAFCDFMIGEEEVEGYPTPVPTAIKNGNYALYTEDIEPYIAIVSELYAVAVASSIKEGDDCTAMLVNPSFSTGDFTGWTYRSGKLGNKNVECYEQVVDIYQMVENVPDGIYSISVQAFERPANNGGFDGSEASKVFLYMNNFKTPVQNICKDLMPLKKAQPAEFDEYGDVIYGTGNCYLDPDGYAYDWPYDYQVDTLGYVPNSIDGARIAFEAGRYVQKCYGVVEDGVMKIGLTSNGVRAHWVLWANFKLTFEGKNAEALASVLPVYIEKANTYLKENSERMTNPAIAEMQATINNAVTALQSEDADAMYDALLALNAALDAAPNNIDAIQTLWNVVATCETTYGYSPFHTEEAEAAYQEVMKTVTAYSEFTTDELYDLVDRLYEVIALLQEIPFDYASEENPINCTSKVLNPECEYYNSNTWWFSNTYAGVLGYSSGTYANMYHWAEMWNEDALGDGMIQQTITGLPAGIYELSAEILALTRDAVLDDVQGVTLFAEDGVQIYWSDDEGYLMGIADTGTKYSTSVATGDWSSERFSLRFQKTTDGPLMIGLETQNTTANWVAFDDVNLLYYGKGEIGDNYLAINDVKAFVGKQITVPIELINSSEITGIEFDLFLPEGVTLEDYEWAGRQGKKHSANFAYNEDTGTYKVLIFSSSSDPFSGNEGTLLDLVLNVDDVMEEGQYGYGMINIKLVTPDERVFRPADTYAAFFIHNTLRGDANGDGIVDITDVVSVVNYILGRPSDRFNFAGADINNSGDIDVVDVVGIVNIILQRDVAGAKSRDMEALSNALMMLSETNGMNVLVENAAKFAAMQFDVVVSDNANLFDAILNSSSDHQISFAKIDANRYRVIAFSMDNESFEPTEDALIQLVLSNSNATIENATFVAADGRNVQMNIGDATGIAGISSKSQEGVIYNLAGQRMGISTKSLPTGVYIRNGKRILVR